MEKANSLKKWVTIWWPNGASKQYTTCHAMEDTVISLVADIAFEGPVVVIYEDVDGAIEANRYHLPYWGQQW